MMQKKAKMLWGLYILRLGLGCFLALWAIDKLVAPEEAIKIFSHFYFIDLSPSIVMILGALELVLSLLIILGMYKTFTYGTGLLIHTISTAFFHELVLNPFGKNHFFIAVIPILFAFIALFLLREFDTKFCLGRKKSIFSHN